MNEATENDGTGRQFPATRYSLIEGSRSPEPQARQRALEMLICAYWKPVYMYVRPGPADYFPFPLKGFWTEAV